MKGKNYAVFYFTGFFFKFFFYYEVFAKQKQNERFRLYYFSILVTSPLAWLPSKSSVLMVHKE
jgi:hypothetical protein